MFAKKDLVKAFFCRYLVYKLHYVVRRQISLGEQEISPRHEHYSTNRVERIGIVARWQPVHNGHLPVLRALCDCADQAIIGIGSSNRHGVRNPFSLLETADMIQLVLDGRENYTLLPVPDLGDGPRWSAMIVELFGPLDLFVTANPYVWSLLTGKYELLRPVELIPPDARVAIDGTMVRSSMARGHNWRALVPDEVADYITNRQLDERFRREFGLQTLAMNNIIQ